jgi:2'-5' RNA ligase
MSSPGSVEGHERLRLFAALPLPEETIRRLGAWQQSELADAPDTRLVRPENLHVTLAFLGPRPATDVDGVVEVLRASGRAVERPVLTAAHYRETRSVGMLVLDDEERRATRLAQSVGKGLERLGVYRPEARRWLPHVTVLRFRRASGLRPEVPDLGQVSPSEVALYHSVLRPTGAQYEILTTVPLGG